MSKITDTKISKLMNVSRDTLLRWKKELDRYPVRYEMFKLGAFLIENDIQPYRIQKMLIENESFIKENKDLRNKIKELEDGINAFVDREEKLRGIIRNE